MNACKYCDRIHRLGFISTRIAGTDGVSLETEKWAEVFQREGFECFYFAGELDRPPEISMLYEKAHFKHPVIKKLNNQCYGVTVRNRSTTKEIYALKVEMKDALYDFMEKFDLDLLVPENILTIPLNIPLGLALTEVISETGIPTIAHHHDFFWERQNFKTNAVWEYLNMAFPPHIPHIHHAVINTSADNQLSLRTGISATVIPNVMDFDNPPPTVATDDAGRVTGVQAPVAADRYACDVRRDLGVAEDELLILQPTRVVKRKGIEHAIELVSRLNLKAKLVISHASGDEGYDYEGRVREYSRMMNVDTIFVSDIINHKRGKTAKGKKIYTLYDIYPHADLVTYPSNFEGFGNAFLEAVYFCKPILVNTYSIYSMDIKPKGFAVVEMDGYVSAETVAKARKVLSDATYRRKMVAHNYKIATTYYSYTVLRRKLRNLLTDCMACLKKNDN
ncbi:MAG: Glycosyltransferase [Olavius algarvensis Delta 4 endosymbiont]|nr:MAG: Glycosyltransferase [Olavius algarvensis Delta 4 endosymbiont]